MIQSVFAALLVDKFDVLYCSIAAAVRNRLFEDFRSIDSEAASQAIFMFTKLLQGLQHLQFVCFAHSSFSNT